MFFKKNNPTIISKFERGKKLLKKGGNKQLKEAYSLFLECSKKNHTLSLCELSRMYYRGIGVKIDLQEALKLAKKAYNQGKKYDVAAFDLGYIYYKLGDEEKAYKYYEIAANNDIPQAVFNLALMTHAGEGIKRDIEKAITLFWKNTILTQNNKPAFYELGCLYYYNTDIPNNYIKAIECFEKSYDYKIDGANRIGVIYEYALGNVKKDINKAVYWYKKAAAKGEASALYHLGAMYSRGLGVHQSHKKAFKLYTKSAEKGRAIAQYHLGLMYENGEGVKKDELQASKLYKKAMEQGFSNAFYTLGLSYFYGRGVSTNKKKAKELISRAAEKEVPGAKEFLEDKYHTSTNQSTRLESLNIDQSAYREENQEPYTPPCPRCLEKSGVKLQCRNCGCIFCTTCRGYNVLCSGRGCPVCDNGCGGEIA